MLFRPGVLPYIGGSLSWEKCGVKNFGGVALFQSKALVAPPGANSIRHFLAVAKVFQTTLKRCRILLPVLSYYVLNFFESGKFEPPWHKSGVPPYYRS